MFLAVVNFGTILEHRCYNVMPCDILKCYENIGKRRNYKARLYATVCDLMKNCALLIRRSLVRVQQGEPYEKTFEFEPLVFSRKSFCFVKVLCCNAFFYLLFIDFIVQL